jgi:hypothetical protein
MKGRDEELEKVPLSNGQECTMEYPTIAKLIVAGKKRLPAIGDEEPRRNDWNASVLLLFSVYLPPCPAHFLFITHSFFFLFPSICVFNFLLS